MAKISQLTATTSPADTDSLPIENTSGTITTKRITISSLASTIANKVRSLLSIGSASSLKTSSKEIVGAVNEVHDSVNSLIDISLDHDEALADLRDSNASLSTSVAQLNTKMQIEIMKADSTGGNYCYLPKKTGYALISVETAGTFFNFVVLGFNASSGDAPYEIILSQEIGTGTEIWLQTTWVRTD